MFFILGFFTQGRWEEIAAESDPALQKLASTLPGIVLSDRAQSTVSTYLAAFQRWEKWALSFKFSTLPAKPAHLCLYFASLIQSARTCSPVVSAAAAIAWAHEKAGVDDPTLDPLVQQVVKGARRMLAKPPTKKDPLTVEHIRVLMQHWCGPSATLMELQVVTLIVVGFTTFLRWDELSRLTARDIAVHDSHASVFIESRKNDHFMKATKFSLRDRTHSTVLYHSWRDSFVWATTIQTSHYSARSEHLSLARY